MRDAVNVLKQDNEGGMAVGRNSCVVRKIFERENVGERRGGEG